MNAVISGRSGLALVIDGEKLLSLDVDDLETLVPRSQSDLRFLLADANDLVTLENTGHTDIAQRLDLEHDIACALDMTLISLDPDTSMELRAEAVEALDELLDSARVIERLEFTMFAKPLPEAADLIGALFCTNLKTVGARSFLERLEGCQIAIAAVREAWDALPDRLFGDDPSDKALFHDTALREGLFRLLALSYDDQSKISVFLLEVLKNRSISGLRNYREVVKQWSAPIRAAVRPDDSGLERESDDGYETAPEAPRHSQGRDKRRRREPADVVLRKVESQKKLIVVAMKERDLPRARQVLEELVDFHRETGRPEHLVKTLCDLAMEAKAIGNVALQLELTNRAVEAKPDDGWSWAQYGDALLNAGQMSEAEHAYEQADAFGAGAVAKVGRAEVLKAQGKLVEAELAFDEVIAAHPENAVAKTGRAEVIKAQGRLVEAEAAFDKVIAAHPEHVVAKTGRAEVLKAQGKLLEAERAFDEVIAAHPSDVVAKTGRAEVLKAQGKLLEAERAFDEVIAAHPENVVAKNGRAEVLKREGRLQEAVAAYERILNSHPNDLVARNARSCVLAVLGRYDESLHDLPTENPGTEEEWIGYHIRGVTLLRRGDIEAASQVFELGTEFCPWGTQAALFAASLALAQIRTRRYGVARDMLGQVTTAAIKPHAQVLQIHALGELKEFDAAFTVYTDLMANPRPFSDDLPDEFHSRYIAREGGLHDDAWVYDREADMFLLNV